MSLPSATTVPTPVAVKKAGIGECTLGVELDLEFVRKELAFKGCVFADVAADHLADLACLQEEPQAEVIDSGVVADAGEVLDAAVAQRHDEVLGDAAETEAADHDRHAVSQDAGFTQVGEAGGGCVENLVAHAGQGYPRRG